MALVVVMCSFLLDAAAEEATTTMKKTAAEDNMPHDQCRASLNIFHSCIAETLTCCRDWG
jgi:hypothetical protein